MKPIVESLITYIIAPVAVALYLAIWALLLREVVRSWWRNRQRRRAVTPKDANPLPQTDPRGTTDGRGKA